MVQNARGPSGVTASGDEGVSMALRFTPRDDRFYTMFSAAAKNLVTGAGLLREQIGADVDDRPEIASRMRDAEHAGDDITHEIFSTVNSTFVTPFDREDIYQLAGRIDDVLDHLDAAADLIVLYRPAELPAEVGAQAEVLVRAADLTATAMEGLRAPQSLSDYWIEINRLENEADQVHRRLLATLFSGMYEPMEVLKLKDVVEELEAAADAFEHLAHAVQTIAAKEA
jgi:predicted phosphate transport protein (TIGR00153 family)